MEHENAIKIAVVEEQVRGLREQQKAHHAETKGDLVSLQQAVYELTAVMNRGKGAYAASLAIAGAIGAFIMSVTGWVVTKVWG